MVIKILGSGCANCKKLEDLARSVVQDLGIQAEIQKITSIPEITSYGVFKTPGLIINDKVILQGKLPVLTTLHHWISDAAREEGILK